MERKIDLGLEAVLAATNGPSSLSRRLKGSLTPQAISQWRRVPAERVLAVSEVTGIPLHVIRPDLYPDQSSGNEADASSREIDKNYGVA